MRIKNTFILFAILGIFTAAAFAKESAIIRRSYAPDEMNNSSYTTYTRPASSALIEASDIPDEEGISELRQKIEEEPDNYLLYAYEAGAYLKSHDYEKSLNDFIFLYEKKKEGLLDDAASSVIKKLFSGYKKLGRRSSGLDLNLAVMSLISDNDAADYLVLGTSVKNKETADKVTELVLDSYSSPDKAIDVCNRILEKNSANPEVRKAKAEFLVQMHRLKEAETEYSKVLELNPGDDEARYDFYKLIAAANKYDTLYAVKKLYGNSDSPEKGYAGLTELLISRNNYKAAKNYAADLMQKYPQNPDGYIYTAEIYKHEGRLKDAYETLVLARNKTNSSETAAKYNVLLAKLSEEPVKEADNLIANGLYEQALEVLDSANPEDLYVILTRAKADYHAGNTEKAFEDLNRAMSLYADNSEVYCAFADVYYKEKDTESARKYISRSLKLAPDNTKSKKLLDLINQADSEKYTADILNEMEMQNYEEALRLVNEALKINEKSADLHYFKGLINIARNEYYQASEEFYRCIELNRDYTDAYFYLAAAFDNLSDKKSALKCYKQFLDAAKGKELGRTERIEYANKRIQKINETKEE